MCINEVRSKLSCIRLSRESHLLRFFSFFFLFFFSLPLLRFFVVSNLFFYDNRRATFDIVSPLRAVDKMHFVIAIDPLHSVLMRKWPDLHSCPAIRTESMNHSVRSMIPLPPPPTTPWLWPVVGKFIFNVHAERHRVPLYSVLILTET